MYDKVTEHYFILYWFKGKTGYPFIDAIMTQLRQEGWIHHLARHSVACFLTRGDLWISWEQGMKVFDEYLLGRSLGWRNCIPCFVSVL